MASWRGTVDIPAPEVRRLTTVLPLVAARLRRLEESDGVVLDPFSGGDVLGLRVAEGVHPQPGARYETWLDEGTPDWAATLEADDGSAVRATVIDQVGGDDEMRLTVEVPTPSHPTEVRLQHLMAISDEGFMAGSVESEAVLSWATTALADSGVHRVLTVSLGHPRFRAGVVADAEPLGDMWRVTADGFVSGRGMARPLFGLMMLFVARRLRGVLDEHLADVAERVEAWNATFAEHPDDDQLADEIVDRWLDRFRADPD